MVVEAVAEQLRAADVTVTIQRAEKSQPEDLRLAEVVILASPTYGHGILERYMEAFVKKLKKMDFAGQEMAVVGVGEPKYELQYHIESANILEQLIQNQNGQLLLPSLRISGTPVRFLDTLIPHWSKMLIEKLK